MLSIYFLTFTLLHYLPGIHSINDVIVWLDQTIHLDFDSPDSRHYRTWFDNPFWPWFRAFIFPPGSFTLSHSNAIDCWRSVATTEANGFPLIN